GCASRAATTWSRTGTCSMSGSTSEPWATAAPLPPPEPPAAPRPSWVRIVAAAAFLIVLGLGQQVGCFAALTILPFSVRLAAVAVVGPLLCLLLAMAIADAARVAPGLPGAIYGVNARSVKVWSTLGVVLAYVFVANPILQWVTNQLGLTGTTSVELGHRSWWFVVVTAIATVLVA